MIGLIHTSRDDRESKYEPRLITTYLSLKVYENKYILSTKHYAP